MTYVYVPIYKNNESPHLELTYSEEGVLYFYIFYILIYFKSTCSAIIVHLSFRYIQLLS